jgi:putative oxidoreductase
MIFAMTSDAICSVLIGLGLATRWACTIIAINLTVAFLFVHHAKLHGPGELAWLYLWAAVMLFLAGPGRYSIDGVPRGD